MRRQKLSKTRKRVFFGALKDLSPFFEKKEVGDDEDEDDEVFVCW